MGPEALEGCPANMRQAAAAAPVMHTLLLLSCTPCCSCHAFLTWLQWLCLCSSWLRPSSPHAEHSGANSSYAQPLTCPALPCPALPCLSPTGTLCMTQTV